jgi:hypothetical protein
MFAHIPHSEDFVVQGGIFTELRLGREEFDRFTGMREINQVAKIHISLLHDLRGQVFMSKYVENIGYRLTSWQEVMSEGVGTTPIARHKACQPARRLASLP